MIQRFISTRCVVATKSDTRLFKSVNLHIAGLLPCAAGMIDVLVRVSRFCYVPQVLVDLFAAAIAASRTGFFLDMSEYSVNLEYDV